MIYDSTDTNSEFSRNKMWTGQIYLQ